ncbi:MAG: MFS transporter [Actinomycetota bacterium]|nr:MFS transporter [Actinomycetota bacterium]
MGLADAFAPLREQEFRLLWLGRVSSAVGDALMPVALAFAVLSVNGSPTALGGVLAAFMVARVGFTLIGGVVADRLPRRAVMLACDGLRAVVEAFTATMLLTHQMTLPLFFATAALFGAASAFFGPASDGLVPQTISAANLQPANALLGLSQNTMNVFGPAVSGVLIAVAGTGWVFAIDACSFAASAFFLLQLDLPAQVREVRSHFLRELREGFHEVTSRAWVRAPIVGFAITNFCFASFIVLGPVIFRERLGGAREWGLVSTCGAIGAIFGSLASVRLRPRRPLTLGFVTTMLIGAPIATLARPLPAAAIAVAWGFGMASIALNNTYWETTLQRRIPASVFARVRSYDILVSFVFMPIGFVAFPLISKAVGVEATLLAAAAVAATTSLVIALVPGVRAITDEGAVPPFTASPAVPAGSPRS